MEAIAFADHMTLVHEQEQTLDNTTTKLLEMLQRLDVLQDKTQVPTVVQSRSPSPTALEIPIEPSLPSNAHSTNRTSSEVTLDQTARRRALGRDPEQESAALTIEAFLLCSHALARESYLTISEDDFHSTFVAWLRMEGLDPSNSAFRMPAVTRVLQANGFTNSFGVLGTCPQSGRQQFGRRFRGLGLVTDARSDTHDEP